MRDEVNDCRSFARVPDEIAILRDRSTTRKAGRRDGLAFREPDALISVFRFRLKNKRIRTHAGDQHGSSAQQKASDAAHLLRQRIRFRTSKYQHYASRIGRQPPPWLLPAFHRIATFLQEQISRF